MSKLQPIRVSAPGVRARRCEIDYRMPFWRRAGRTASVVLAVCAGASLGPRGPGSIAAAQLPKTVDARFAAPNDKALVVFSRPRKRQASEVALRVVSQGGRCLAELRNDAHMAVPMWPGRHMVMLITGTAPPIVQLLQLKLSAGKTYIVKLRPRVNTARPFEVQVVRRADQPLEAFPPEARELLPAEPDLRKCTEWVTWKRARIESRAERVKFDWDEASDEFRDAHTVRRGDGWTADEVRGP